LEAEVNPAKPSVIANNILVGALLLLFFTFTGCSKPLVRNEAVQAYESHREESRAITSGSRGISEAFTADTVIITRFDTVSRETVVAKYYGVKQVKVDTLRQVELVEVKKTDTVAVEKIIKEKNEPSFFDRIKFILFGALLGLIIWFIANIYRRVA